MVREQLEQAFKTVRELYKLKQHDSGMVDPLPFVYAFKDGELLVYSAFGKHSATLAAQVGIELPSNDRASTNTVES